MAPHQTYVVYKVHTEIKKFSVSHQKASIYFQSEDAGKEQLRGQQCPYIGSSFATASLIGAILPREMSSATDKLLCLSAALASNKYLISLKMFIIKCFQIKT